jgi:hypothetical protein
MIFIPTGIPQKSYRPSEISCELIPIYLEISESDFWTEQVLDFTMSNEFD